jgi:hypothetical protein
MNMNREPAADTGPDPERARDASAARTEAAEDAEMLRDLARIGMDIARSLRVIAEAQAAQAVAQPTQAPAGIDPGLGFSRVSRAVRLTLALKTKLLEEGQQRDRKEREEAQERKIAAARKQRRKTEVASAVEQAIEDDVERGEGGDAEQLRADLRERLDEPDIDGDLGKCTVGDIVQRVCRDLGIIPDWGLWEKEAWYVDEEVPLEDDDDEEEDAEPAEAPVQAEPAEPAWRKHFPIDDVPGYRPWAKKPDPPESEDG